MSRGGGSAGLDTPQASFLSWQQQAANADLIRTAEKLLEQLEDTSELLTEIDQKYILSSQEEPTDAHKMTMIQRFHGGLDCARELICVLQREKWRLSKREMSVEIRIGELDDYKKHLKSDMSSLNMTVDALSMRVVQLENQLVEAQEIQENLEAELKEHRSSLQDSNDRNIHLYTENQDLRKAVKDLSKSTLKREIEMLKDEVAVLQDENRKLKDMVRDAEARASPLVVRRTVSVFASSPPGGSCPSSPRSAPKDDNLMKLTKEFLDDLTSLELRADDAEAAKKTATRANGETPVPSPSLLPRSSSSATQSVSSVTIDVKAEYV